MASITTERVFAYVAAENTDLVHRSWSADHGGLLEPRPLQRATQSSQGPSSGLPRAWWQRVQAGRRDRPPRFTHIGRRRTIHVYRCGLRKNSAEGTHKKVPAGPWPSTPGFVYHTGHFSPRQRDPKILRKTQFDDRDVHIPVTPSMSLHARPRLASTSGACRRPGTGHLLLFYHRDPCRLLRAEGHQWVLVDPSGLQNSPNRELLTQRSHS